jgi:aspartate aminotransferase
MVLNKKISDKFDNLIGSEIIKLSKDINNLIRDGHKIFNLTIGDFDPAIYPIPKKLLKLIKKNYSKYTNYPEPQGDEALRNILSTAKMNTNISYTKDEVLIANGARSLIYAVYQATVNPGEKVIYPVPSWNNNHYTYLVGGIPLEIETKPENNFLLTSQLIKLNMGDDVALISLCSPQNPTGTELEVEEIKKIFQYIESVNKKRIRRNIKPVYILFDHIYSGLTLRKNYNWEAENIKDYLIIIDGVSKNMAATGLRIGWCYAPTTIIDGMKKFLSHLGAWAPHPEQIALREYLKKLNSKIDKKFYKSFNQKIYKNLDLMYDALIDLKNQNYPIDVIKPTGAIYLTVKINLLKKKFDGQEIKTIDEVTKFLLTEAYIALVPFKAFGSKDSEPWFRLSIGTIRKSDIKPIIDELKMALDQLSD